MPKLLCENTQCGTSLKIALGFSTVFSKKLNFAKYENLLHFFSKVISTKLDFSKYENRLDFIKGFFKETQSSQNMKTTFLGGFFQRPMIHFCPKFLNLRFLVSYNGISGIIEHLTLNATIFF
jgi:hypothetical protein